MTAVPASAGGDRVADAPAGAPAQALAALDARARRGRWRHWFAGAGLLAFYALCWRLTGVDLGRLAAGLPKMGRWIVSAWPPSLAELPLFGQRMAETVAMAALGTTIAVLLALPMAVLAARRLTPWPATVRPARMVLNALRGIDSFVFALLFVAAVGLGPFAGVLGVALHTWGSAAKNFADHLENVALEPFEAVRSSGAGHATALAYAVWPDVQPVLLSSALFWWEFNVRASTVLGVVGAGGIGLELKNSLDLLDFPRLLTILVLIVAVVTAIDALSGWLRRRLT